MQCNLILLIITRTGELPSSYSFLQPAASKAIFLSNDSDSPPPIERVRAGPIVSAVGRIDDFLSEDIPDFVQNMVRAKPGKRGSTGKQN